jgi:hypothetical protein
MSRVTKQELSRVMSHLGSRKSEAKTKAARANAKKPRSRKQKSDPGFSQAHNS